MRKKKHLIDCLNITSQRSEHEAQQITNYILISRAVFLLLQYTLLAEALPRAVKLMLGSCLGSTAQVRGSIWGSERGADTSGSDPIYKRGVISIKSNRGMPGG